MTRKKAVARKPRVDGLEARARILDTAEALFAQRGFHGTSVRDITERAGVRLASVNYHFVSKETLFRDVLLRRADALAEDRLALLERVPGTGPLGRRVRGLVGAFVLPPARRASESDGWRSYLALIAQVANSRLEALLLVEESFNRVALRFIAALGALSAGSTTRSLHRGYQFMLGATLYAFSGNQRLESLTRGALRSDDPAQIAADLIAFLTPALQRSCSSARKRVDGHGPGG
jgi:AcrR family transcriptional regulator